MKHCKRFFSFLAALALLLSLSLPSLSMAESGQAEDGARSPVEASVEHAAEDADPWEEAEPRGDGEEAPAPEYPALQEDADDANDAPSAAFPEFPEEAEDAESTAEADPTEFATLSEEDEPAGAEADPAEAQLPELSETDGPAGDEADPAEAPAPEDAALSEADAPHWDDDGEAPPPEFPGLWEEPETDAALVAEGELLRLTADTRWNSLDNIHVVVEADAGVLPPDTLLRAAAVKDPDILRRAREAVESADRRAALVQALELGFFGPDGAALEPEGPVRVTLYSYRAARFRELELVSVLDDWTDVVETTQNLASLGFEVYESGVYAIVGTEAVVFEHLSARGGAASVTVSYDPERFGFLRDASLEVRELEGEELERYLAAAAEALAAVDKDPDEPEAPDESEGRDEPEDPGEAGEEAGRGLAWARFFDVRLTAPDGTEYHELGGDVRVTVTLDEPLEVPEDCALYAVHFADGPEAPPELTEAALSDDGTELTFTQSGFSATGTVLEYQYGDGNHRWWPDVWNSQYLYQITEDWLPYVVLVKEPGTDGPYYMLEVDTSTEYDEVSSTRTYTRYRVKLVEANVKEVDGTLSLSFDDKPEKGVYYNSFDDISQWIWYHHQYNNKGNINYRNSLKNAATGCLLGTAVVTDTPTKANLETWTTEYCAGTVSVEEGQYPNDAFYLDFPGVTDSRYFRRLYSQNKLTDPRNKYVWYFMKDGDYLKGVTNRKEYSASSSANADARLPPDANSPTLSGGGALAPNGVLEFYFASEIRINGQNILTPATFPYDPNAVNSYGSGDNAYKAEDPYGDKNPYSFHTYADNPDNDALPPSITPDPPAAKKTLTPQGDGSYELSLSVTADAGENAMPDASAEVVLVVDVSESMDNPKNNPDVRPAIAQEREVLLQIGKMLKEKQVPFHVILFSTGAWTDGKTYTAQNYGEFEVMVNGLTTRLGGNTCWEAALHLAGKVLKQIDAAEDGSEVNYKDKYVMFISDGKPNRHVRDTKVDNPYQITEFSQSFGGTSVPGWGYAEGQSSGGNSGVEIQMRPLLLEQKLVAAGANVINVFIQSNEKDGIGPMWMKRMSNIAYAGGIYTQEPPAGTYYWADAANEGEIAGELISATRFILRKFLYQDVSLTDGLTEGTALAGTTELAPEGAVPDFSYTITLKNGTEYIGEFPEGVTTALRFCRNTDDGIRYLTADGSETANAEEAVLLGEAKYNADDSTRTVNWDIKPPNAGDGAHYTLIEDATYTVSFPVWPTQETYDAISGRENNKLDIELPQGLSPLEEFDYSFLRSHPPTSLSSLFELLDILPADVQQVVSGDPAGISVSEEEGNWTMTVAQNLDHPVVLTITTKATAEQDSRAIVVRAIGVGGVSHAASALQTCTYSFPFAAPPPTLSNLFELLDIDASDVTEAVSSDPEGMVLKRAAPTWTLTLSKDCHPALLTLTMDDGSVIAVYVTDSGEDEAAVTNVFPSDVQRYDYPFSFKQAPTSLSRLFALLELLPETVDGIVSSDPANLAVTHAALGKWKLQVAEGLTQAAVLTITKKNGDIIAVYVTDTEDALKSGTFHFEEYDYTFPSDHPPTSLSGLFALLGISPADVKWVMSGDPAGISVTADVNTPGKWNVVVAANLAQPTLLTLIMQDDSVFAIHASPVEASQRIAPQEYTYTFPRTPALTSPANLFELLKISQEDVYMLVSDDPAGILVSKAATGDWTLQVAENLDRPVLLTITKQNGELIAVHATPSGEVSAGSIAEPDSPWVLREYRSPFDAAPTLLSELFALTEITEANAVKVVSSDPAGISVTGGPGNWSLQVMPGLDHGVLLTITMVDGSVIPVYVTDSEESATRITSRSWGLSTNTKGTAVNYTPRLRIQENGEPPKWRNFPSGREEIENPDPVELAAWTVNARKVWMDSGTEHSAIKSLTLHLHQVSNENENHDYIGEIELTGRDGWLSADFSISPGMMVEKTAETASWGKAVTFDGAPYVLLNEGYGYYFTEELPDSAGDLFQLEEDVFYPMLVDGVPVNATRVGDAYTDVGRLVKPLQVKNRLNGIEITKQVVDDAGKAVSPQDTVTTDEATGQAEPVLFPMKVTLMAPEGGDLSGFPQLDKDDPDSPRIVRYSVYDWEWNSLTNNYLIFNERGVAEDVIDLPNGGTIFFPSVPEGTRYAVEEPETSMPEGYSFQNAAYLIRDPDTHQYRNADSVTVEADGKTVTRYLAIDGENRVNVINLLIGEIEKESVLPRIVIDKFQTGDNTQKLSGAAFALYRYPSAEELEADETLGAETPLYYWRPDPDKPPTFTPDKDQALTVITDADGRAEFTDLPDGVYYLLETEAPIDYHRLIAPIAVTVDTSWLETAVNPTQAQIAAASVFTVHIANTPKTTLPATGGPGPARQAGLAPLLLGVGAAGLVILRRKRKTAGR